MATVLKKTDVAIVGFGWVGAIMAKELTEAGLNVVALERGPMRDTWPDGAYPQVIDDLQHPPQAVPGSVEKHRHHPA
jgi:gluconate 2-dehydrogenase alpha chain